MKRSPRPFVRYLYWITIVWAVLLALYAAGTFLFPHDGAREPEMGRTATLLIFAVSGSVLYFIVTLGVYLIASIASESVRPK